MHNHTKKINNQDSSTKSPSTTIESIKDTESKKLDSNGDEIVWQSKMQYYIAGVFQYILYFILGIFICWFVGLCCPKNLCGIIC